MKTLTQSVKIAGGIELQYVEHGAPDGIPVVLLHGVTDSWRSFEPLLHHLTPSLRALALTQRGHGDSDRPARGYRTRDFASDVAEFARALELGPAVIVGHSMGSTNALRFAIDHPQRTLGLVLVGAFATYRGNPGLAHFWESAIQPLSDPIAATFVREFQESTLARPVPPELLDTAVEESLKLPARVWCDSFAGFFEDDFVSDVGRIDVPTLIAWGDHDSLCPRADQDALLAAIAGSRLKVYAGGGHALHWEDPRGFADDLASFVAALDVVRRG